VLSIGVATGHYALRRAKFEREKQKRKITELTPATTRALYGRERDIQEFAARFQSKSGRFEANASQALFLTYNPLIQKQLQPEGGNLVERLSKETDNKQAAREAIFTILSRPAEQGEVDRTVEFLSNSDVSRSQLCQELVWALVCSGEFRFNH